MWRSGQMWGLQCSKYGISDCNNLGKPHAQVSWTVWPLSQPKDSPDSGVDQGELASESANMANMANITNPLCRVVPFLGRHPAFLSTFLRDATALFQLTGAGFRPGVTDLELPHTSTMASGHNRRGSSRGMYKGTLPRVLAGHIPWKARCLIEEELLNHRSLFRLHDRC